MGETQEKVDLLLKNGRLINVLSGEIYKTDVAINGTQIFGLGTYPARKIINLKNQYLAPGFIDGHVHIESSLVTPAEFARTVLPLGTTTVICDPHEIANVLGLTGIKYVMESNKITPIEIFVMLPSCVPATHLETSGATLTSRHLKPLMKHPDVLGLAEMMNYPGVISRHPEVLKKIKLAQNKIIDGHAPGLTGPPLAAYIRAGITSDHECTTRAEALEKLRSGMYLMIREGSAAKNLTELLKIITPLNSRRCFFVTDDRHPADLLKEGHLNFIVKKAVRSGLNPVQAIQMATINTAAYFRLKKLGAIAPGYQADLVVLDNLKNFRIRQVYKKGQLGAQDGFIKKKCHYESRCPPGRSNLIKNTIKLNRLTPERFQIKAQIATESGQVNKIRVIGIVPGQIITREIITTPTVQNGLVVSDPKRDILKIAVVERHRRTGRVGLGFVKGIGLKKGALASSVAHDSHNIIVVGTNDADMLKAVQVLGQSSGGQVLVVNGQIPAHLPLTIAGLISDRPIREVAQKIKLLNRMAHRLGCKLTDPFMTLSFLALAPVPELKLTDRGLVAVKQFRIVPLLV